MLSLRFKRAGFCCHKRAPAYQTVKVYVEPGVMRPLLNPRLGRIIRASKSGLSVELDIYFYSPDVERLEEQLQQAVEEHGLEWFDVESPEDAMDSCVILTFPLRLHSDGLLEPTAEARLDQALRDLHRALT